MTGLDTDCLIAAARQQTGLHDFADERFRPALDVLTRAIKEEAGLTAESIEQARAEFTSALATRLKVDDFFRRYPAIDAQPIVAPVVIVGLQRTGTSKLFRLVAADPQWNVLLTWQALNPVPLGTDRAEGPDPRIALAEQWVANVKWMQAAHSFDAHAPEMEALLLMHCFQLNHPGRLVPSHQIWCETAAFGHVYLYLRRMLKFLQWQNRSKPGRRWILKTPAHLLSLPALVEAFPDATLVMTHRHPAVSVASMMRLVELSQERGALKVNRDRIRDLWLRNLSTSMRRYLEFCDGPSGGKFVDVGFQALMSDPLGSVKTIYERAGMPFTVESERHIAQWERDNPQHKDGAFHYRLGDYGLTAADIEQAFAEYIRRYGHLF